MENSTAIELDRIDARILTALQADANQAIADLAEAVGLSANACWRRIKRLEELGIIRARVALLDPAKIDLGVTVFVAIRTNEHNDAWLQKFNDAVEKIPEIVELYRMSGDVDYLMKVVVASIAHYDQVYKRLIKLVKLTDVSSTFAMEQMKYTTALPVHAS
ncbi:Lrp/AsnC family transcriptional regulator [Dongia rigui]|uniref:Lrp/AsnC family transcriptional regulator n=1 Tax=Dongia rigui TaxID=940149 RepID=A0ABU5E0D9_9PROT|nr:Lrp/AsnC family transcriptional regulator [Dongia rigui]MDY0872949.1 Lrp/AsnC family transcriptional regulator [Dongia rigui]